VSELEVWCVSKLVAKLESVRCEYTFTYSWLTHPVHVLAVDPELRLGIWGRPRVLIYDVNSIGDSKR